jgi:hypothetical protein
MLLGLKLVQRIMSTLVRNRRTCLHSILYAALSQAKSSSYVLRRLRSDHRPAKRISQKQADVSLCDRRDTAVPGHLAVMLAGYPVSFHTRSFSLAQVFLSISSRSLGVSHFIRSFHRIRLFLYNLLHWSMSRCDLYSV